MHKRLLVIFIGAMLLVDSVSALNFGPKSSSNAALIDDVGLIINREAISRTQLSREKEQAYKSLPKEISSMSAEALDKLLLERVIAQHLIAQLLEQAKLQITETDIDQAIGSVAQNLGISVADLLARVKKETGKDEQRYRQEIAQQIAQMQLKDITVGGSVEISNADIENQLEQISLQRGSALQVQDLLIPIPEGAIDQRGEQIKTITEKISTALKNNNNDLAAVARETPDARFNDLGKVNIAQIPPRFARGIVGLSVGETTSTPIVDSDGMHFLKIVSKTNEGQASHLTEEAHIAHILVRYDGSDPEASARKINKIYAQLMQNKEDFATVARSQSEDPASAAQGGDLGWVNVERIEPQFAKKIAAVPIGSISEPFKTMTGWHIALVIERHKVDRTEELIREKIRTNLYQQALEDAWQQKIIEMRQNAYIEVR